MTNKSFVIEDLSNDQQGDIKLYEKVRRATQYILEKIPKEFAHPVFAIQCGSGLGTLANDVEKPVKLPYSTIPFFPQTSVPGHDGNLVIGMLEGHVVCCFQGRIHPYEGYSIADITIPIRVVSLLGAQILILTNATGGIAPEVRQGDIVVIEDHMAIPCLAGKNGMLEISNEDRSQLGGKHLGADKRFFGTDDLYDCELRQLFLTLANKTAYRQKVHSGIYSFQIGPQFETPAEVRAMRKMGITVTGMSVAHEALVASHSGMRILAVSLVTNVCHDTPKVCDQESIESIVINKENKIVRSSVMRTESGVEMANSDNPDIHSLVQDAALQATPMMVTLIKLFLSKIQTN
ncbi:hypothetical protein SNEBB_000186 [Seison nebaliae]|nr:hypothetical protein SNEBB_000186 [Seison nebaliae]